MTNVSEYNDDYRCVVTRTVVNGNAVMVHFAVTGDGSLGPLQGAEHSKLFVNGAMVLPSDTQISGDDNSKCTLSPTPARCRRVLCSSSTGSPATRGSPSFRSFSEEAAGVSWGAMKERMVY
jgi:hypothetical protein